MEVDNSEELSQLELLPIEVITVIAGYLDVKDLGACCATSSTMRDHFNDNEIWKARCNTNIAEYLKITPCKVQPRFESPQVNDGSLSPLSEWRISFMRENHLWNNWRQGKYKKELIRSKPSKSTHKNATFHQFLNNDCIIAHFTDGFELLNTIRFPATEATEKVSFFKRLQGLQVVVHNNMILLLIGSCVQVLHVDFSVKQCQLKHAFFFDELEKLQCNEVHEVEKLLDMRKESSRQSNHIRVLVGSFFIGVSAGESTMHVWNVETGQKLKEALCPLKRTTIIKIKYSNNMNLLLAVREIGKEVCTIFAYDLNKLEYFPLNLIVMNADADYYVYNDFVLLFADSVIQVYNYKTSKPIITPVPSQSPPTFINNNFLYIMDEKLHKFNLSSKKVVTLLMDGVTWFELLSNKFVQVKRNRNTEIWEFDQEITEIWEFDRACSSMKKISMDLWFPVCGFFLNKACTRYIVREDLGYVINFW